MKINNYRCLRDVDIRFDDITTFIGPNGVGKSAVLRALDWFFNGPPGGRGLTDDDVWAGAERKQISVGVEFSDLTNVDRDALGKYASGDIQTVWLWRRWEDGSDKLSGRALTYPPFDEIRTIKSALDRRKRYKALSDEHPGLGLPPVKNAPELDEAMARWEREHPERLEGTELDADTHFFGFAGQAKMTGLFDYVFVSADLRAGEEGRDVKGSVIGRILNQAIDRSEAEEEMAELQVLVNANRESIQSKHFGKQLESLSDQLTTEIEQLTMGRRVQVDSLVPELLLPQAQFQVSIQDGTARTRIDQQGHGFQRALLVTALRVLAQSAVTASDRTIFLAIEEPELFQHPVQARAFAAVLRALAADTGHGVQIAYGTHSPYFLEIEGFTQIRRMTREFAAGAPSVRIHSTSAGSVTARLGALLDRAAVDRRLAKTYLMDLPEALFGHAVLLVEGSTDRGVWEGCGQRLDPLNRHGIVVADVGGKDHIAFAHAILTEMGVPCYAVFDGDANCKPEKVEENKRKNRSLVEYLGGVPEDFPVTKVHDSYAIVHENLETYLRSEWPEWEAARRSLVSGGRGVDGKRWATYRQAAVEAVVDPPAWLSDVISKVRDLCPDG
ncbi:ATP-dependent nuclease [Actinomadura formosensis]|uniref:ATP-dependent nuclease n=1 Tax=Actinomadura formosensis TaxID=60706 RepID=UPI003D9212A2